MNLSNELQYLQVSSGSWVLTTLMYYKIPFDDMMTWKMSKARYIQKTIKTKCPKFESWGRLFAHRCTPGRPIKWDTLPDIEKRSTSHQQIWITCLLESKSEYVAFRFKKLQLVNVTHYSSTPNHYLSNIPKRACLEYQTQERNDHEFYPGTGSKQCVKGTFKVESCSIEG